MANDHWHLEKKVSLGLIWATAGIILTLIGQAYLFGQWTANMAERMDQVERRLDGFSERSQAADRAISEQGRDIAVLVEQIEGTNRALDRLHAQMEATNALLRQILTSGPRDGRGNE